MGGTAVAVDVQSVRLVIDNVCVSAEGIKYALRNGGSTSVGAVETDFLALEGSRRNGDQITDVAVSSCREVLRSSDILSLRAGSLPSLRLSTSRSL